MWSTLKKQFKKKVREILFAIFHAEDTYVEAPTLLLKMTKYVMVIGLSGVQFGL